MQNILSSDTKICRRILRMTARLHLLLPVLFAWVRACCGILNFAQGSQLLYFTDKEIGQPTIESAQAFCKRNNALLAILNDKSDFPVLRQFLLRLNCHLGELLTILIFLEEQLSTLQFS